MAEPNDFNARIIEEFRANDGKVGAPFAGAPMVLLTTTGAKSGRKITTPLMYLPDGDRVVVFASKGGSPTHPAWYHNLIANPTVTLEVGSDKFEANATVVTGGEHESLYARQAKLYPAFADYQTKTSRIIPVIALKRQT